MPTGYLPGSGLLPQLDDRLVNHPDTRCAEGVPHGQEAAVEKLLEQIPRCYRVTLELYSQDYTHLYRRSPSRPDILGPRIKSGDERVPLPSAPPSDKSGSH